MRTKSRTFSWEKPARKWHRAQRGWEGGLRDHVTVSGSVGEVFQQ
jgi:hypothetical protein